MPEGKRRTTARRRERSDGQDNSFPADLSEVTRQAFEAGESDPGPESPSGAGESEELSTARPLSNPTDEVVSAELPTKQLEENPPSGSSKERTLSLTTESPTNQTPPGLRFHSQDPGIHAPEAPLPARMLNEFVYCPRLFYYEHVEDVFGENADTLRGAALHARVDKGTGALPAAQSETTDTQAGESETDRKDEGTKPGTEKEKIHSRSVTLGSERLGVIAKLDLVEVRAAGEGDDPDLLSRLDVCPVDYKAGAPREGEDGNALWPTDRMQLGIQIVILRDNGYRCDRGIIYYRATKQRVPLEWTLELEAWISAQVDSARQTMTGPIPPPLVGSQKCVRFSLNSVCLPDETRMLAARAVESLELRVEKDESRERASLGLPATNSRRTSIAAPRRLMAPRDDTRVLYLDTPGVRVGERTRCLRSKTGTKR